MTRRPVSSRIAVFAAALSAFLVFTSSGCPAHAEWFTGAEIRALFDDNLTLAVNRQERKSDSALQSSVSLGHHIQLADSVSFSVTAGATYTGFARFEGLDSLESVLTASLKYKHGLGSYSPWIKFSGSVARFDFREDFRDANSVRSGLFLGKRMSERAFARVGYAYSADRARDTRFDTRNSVVSARMDYLITESVQAWLGYAVSSGVYIIYLPQRAGAARGATVDTFREPQSAVQLYSTTKILSVGATKSMTPHWSANVSADYFDIYGRGRHYPDLVYKAGVVFAY